MTRAHTKLIAVIVVAAATAGLAAPAQARIIGTDLEVILGSSTASALEQRYGLYSDTPQQQRIEKLGKEMVAVSGRAALSYRFGVLNTKEINALAVPGGWIYVTRGLVDAKLTDDELAFVLGHEVAHVAQRHGVDQLEKSLGLSLALGLVFDRSATTQALVSDLLQLLLERGYSRKDEYAADKAAVGYMLQTGHKPQGGVAFLQRLQALSKHKPSDMERWFATHPPMDDRIARLEEDIAVAEKEGSH